MNRICLNYLYLSRNHAGGKDQVGLNLIKGFQDIGVAKNIQVICYDYSVNKIKELSPDCKIVAIKSHNSKKEVFRLLDLLFKNTFIVPKIISSTRSDVLFHLSCMNGLCRLPCKVVTIPHDIKAVSHRKLANVVTPFYKYLIYKFIYYLDFSFSDAIIAISNTDKKEISKHYPRFSSKIHRIYNPIMTDCYECQSKVKKENQIIAINLQFHHKNIITLLKAFNIIKDSIPYQLVLVGGIPDRVKYLKEYVEDNGLNDRVKFTGFLSDDEMVEQLEKSRLYVNPSLYEGFGMTAIEAMLRKVPTLVADIPTNREVTKGLANYYFPPENEQSLSAMILKTLSFPSSEARLEEISNTLKSAYNYKTISQEYYDYFNKI